MLIKVFLKKKKKKKKKTSFTAKGAEKWSNSFQERQGSKEGCFQLREIAAHRLMGMSGERAKPHNRTDQN